MIKRYIKSIISTTLNERLAELEKAKVDIAKLSTALEEMKAQRDLAKKDLSAIKCLLQSFGKTSLNDAHGIPLLGDIARGVESYQHQIKSAETIEWVRKNGTKKGPGNFHGGCAGCKSPETIGYFRCLGCKYLMGVTSELPNLRFE